MTQPSPDDEQERIKRVFEEVRQEDATIEHLYCGHCGGINDVQAVDLKPVVRHICRPCRVKILEWI